jgi:oxygen-independent coproporphyrinogen-3 oxidase
VTHEDRMRAEIIEKLMCFLAVDYAEAAARHGFGAETLADARSRLMPAIEAGLAQVEGTTVRVPERHRLFLRSVAAAFDSHYSAAPNRHAKAV